MEQPDPTSRRRTGVWTALALAAITGAGAVTIALPATLANADPVPPAPPGTSTAAPAPPPADTNAPPPPPADTNAPPPPPADPNAPPPPPADPNAPPPPPAEPGRVTNAVGGLSYVIPAGWVEGDATRLNYGSALLLKETGPAVNGQPAPTANDTSILLGKLDLKLFAGAESNNTKAAIRLASDMGEFFMPYPGTRVNAETVQLNANGMPGVASYYEVKFTDTTKPNGQIWAAAIGPDPNAPANAPRAVRQERWFVVWLGTAKNPVDKAAAKTLAESVRPWSPPPPPAAPPADPNAPPPAPADPNAPPPPPGRAPVGVPVPVTTPVPEMMPPA